jgi:hypothetical protein
LRPQEVPIASLRQNIITRYLFGTVNLFSILVSLLAQYLLVTEFFYSWTMLFLKLSLGLFFLRVLQTPWQRKTVYTVVVVSTLSNIFFSFWVAFECGNPTNYITKLSTGQCHTQNSWRWIGLAQATGNVVIDFILAAMPLPMLWGSKMVLIKKITIGGILILATL